MHVLHSVAHVDPGTGGPARSVTALCRALEAAGLDARLVTQRPQQGELPFALPRHTQLVPRGTWRAVRHFRQAVHALAQGPGPCLAHDHGIWLPTNHAVAKAAREAGLPRVVSPRGMLDAWSLGWHAGRKRLAWRLYQQRDLREAQLLHATSRAEAEGFRAAGLTQGVAVVPNGVEVPDEDSPSLARAEQGPRVALFLSRVHPKKGLPDLLAAWQAVRPVGWELWVAGDGEPAHVAEVREAVQHLPGSTPPVRLLGAVPDGDRARLLARAELFVLPTRSENFGQVVAEALAAGVPVLTTHAAPWPALEAHGAGWWVPLGEEALVQALRAACASEASELAAMGRRGQAWMRAEFAWESVAKRMQAVYAHVLGRGPATADVWPAVAA